MCRPPMQSDPDVDGLMLYMDVVKGVLASQDDDSDSEPGVRTRCFELILNMLVNNDINLVIEMLDKLRAQESSDMDDSLIWRETTSFFREKHTDGGWRGSATDLMGALTSVFFLQRYHRIRLT